MARRVLIQAAVSSLVALGCAGSLLAQTLAPATAQGQQQQQGRRDGGGQGTGQGQAGRAGGSGRGAATPVVLVMKEDFQREANAGGQTPLTPANVSNPNLELKVYGPDAKNLTISGAATGPTPINLWTGLATAPIAATR